MSKTEVSQISAENMAEPHDEDHHVHFDTKTVREDNSDSFVTYERFDDTISVNLGFLKIYHRYLVDLKLPSSLFDKVDQWVKPDIQAEPSLHCCIKEFSGVKNDQHDYLEMKIEFFAYKEKLLKETLHIVNGNNSKEVVQLVIAARVMGKGKGTPMLRNGIHCIGVEDPETDEDENIDARL